MTCKPLTGDPDLFDTAMDMWNVYKFFRDISTPYKSQAVPVRSMSDGFTGIIDIHDPRKHWVFNRMITESGGLVASINEDPWLDATSYRLNRHFRPQSYGYAEAIRFMQQRKIIMTRFRVTVPDNGALCIKSGVPEGNQQGIHHLLFKAVDGGRMWQIGPSQELPYAQNTSDYAYIIPGPDRCQGQKGAKTYYNDSEGLQETISHPVEIDFEPGDHLFEIYVTGQPVKTVQNIYGVREWAPTQAPVMFYPYDYVMHIFIDGEYVTSAPYWHPFRGNYTQFVRGGKICNPNIVFNYKLYPNFEVESMWDEWGSDQTSPCMVWSAVSYLLDYELNGPADSNPVMRTVSGQDIQLYSVKTSLPDNWEAGQAAFAYARRINTTDGPLSLCYSYDPNRPYGTPARSQHGASPLHTVGSGFFNYTGKIESYNTGENPVNYAAGPIWSNGTEFGWKNTNWDRSRTFQLVLKYQFGVPADPSQFNPQFTERITGALRYDTHKQDPSCSFTFYNRPGLGSWADLLYDDIISGYRSGLSSTSGQFNQ